MDLDTVFLETEERMEKTIESLKKDFGKLRTGRASASLVDSIKADYYGTMTAISQMATIAIPDSRTITIQPWDRGGVGVIEKAIMKSDLGLTPVNDGRIIRIAIPPLTEERRKELTKISRKYGEEAKISLRNIRRDANETIKKLEKDKEITEDDLKKSIENIQKLTDKYVGLVDQRCAAKEKEIMEI
ncbi:MAG: ribosome recycling factor [Desulfovibrio sp.]|nr:ribosome recycling factor [Desulfovibrio sp.]